MPITGIPGLLLAKAALAAAAAAALMACAAGTPACTEIAARSGVGITVAADLAPEITGVHLIVCWSGKCVEDSVVLTPGTVPVEQDCATPVSPDAACAATLEPDGTLTGFLDIPDLPAAELEITALASTAGSGRLERTTTAPAELVFPNGPGCGGEAPQVSVTLDRNGLSADDS